MAGESELRDRLHAAGDGPGGIDVELVLRRARARRRPRIAVAAASGVLAVAAVATPVVGIALGQEDDGTLAIATAERDEGVADASDGGIALQPPSPDADLLNLCGAPLAEVPPAANGLVLDVATVVADAGARSIPVRVTLRNTGDERVTGWTAGSPSLALARDGIVLWHTNGFRTMQAVLVDLEPGEHLHYDAWFSPLVCSAEDDAAGFRPDLPAAGPGVYELAAVIGFTPEQETAEPVPVLVTGPAVRVDLRG